MVCSGKWWRDIVHFPIRSLPHAAILPNSMRPLLLRFAALLLITVLAVACQRASDRAAEGSDGVAFSRQQAAAIQDSLARVIEPGHFHAVLAGGPFSRGLGAEVENLDPHGTVRIEPAPGQEATTRFAMEDEEGSYVVDLLLERSPDAADSSALPPPGAYVQRADQLPTVQAALQQGQRRFESRGGSLVLEEDSTGLRGRFFFEMRPPDASSEDWFSLVGVFGPAQMP